MLSKFVDAWDTTPKWQRFASLGILGSGVLALLAYQFRTKSLPILDKIIPNLQTKDDCHTFSNYNDVCVNQLTLDLHADFDKKRLIGTATLKIEIKTLGVREVNLDIWHLKIHSVTQKIGNDVSKLRYTISDVNKLSSLLGLQLGIQLKGKFGVGQTLELLIKYETEPENMGIIWLEPHLTHNHRFELMFTNSKPTFARCLFPCQDTPAIKMLYEANITVDATYNVYTNGKCREISDLRSSIQKYCFGSGNTKLPAYLINFVIGELEFNDPDGQGVVTEGNQIPQALEKNLVNKNIVKTLQGFIDNVAFDIDHLIFLLPPYIPSGTIENPTMTLLGIPQSGIGKNLSENLIRPLVSSLTSNLLTFKNWKPVWILEGLNMYFAYKIEEVVAGKEEAELSAYISYKEYLQSCTDGDKSPEMGKLNPKLVNINPLHYISSDLSQKGFLFMMMLEKLLGEEELKRLTARFFKDFASKPVSNESFKDFLHGFVSENFEKPENLKMKISYENWLESSSLKGVFWAPTWKSPKIKTIESQAGQFLNFVSEGGDQELLNALRTFNDKEIQIFLQYLISSSRTMEPSKIEQINQILNTETHDIKVLIKWLVCCCKYDYQPAYIQLEKLLQKSGDVQILKPLYRAVYNNDPILAEQLYKKYSGGYTKIAQELLEPIIQQKISML